MRTFTLLLFFAGSLFANTALAEARLDIEKTKTGILPSGEFYSLYNVNCQDSSSAAVVSMDRQRQWCFSPDGELSCFSTAQKASQMACAAPNLAAAEGASEETGRTN
ncbi:MAG: hypothetical protein NXI15_04110 [Gammaproteobacteria bacterium]|nr:hypothetical protein [Gammaproteobacteria bacterium]